MTNEEMKAEVGKLNVSQRNRMRAIVPSALSSIKVEQIGWVTRIVCESNGYRYTAKIGPRGRKVAATQVMEVTASDVAW